jgi:hypothetical protein
VVKIISNIRVGKPDTTPSMSSHTWGVREGNRVARYVGDPGHYYTGERGAGRPVGKANPARSTGINPEAKNPIDPSMPHLSPA